MVFVDARACGVCVAGGVERCADARLAATAT